MSFTDKIQLNFDEFPVAIFFPFSNMVFRFHAGPESSPLQTNSFSILDTMDFVTTHIIAHCSFKHSNCKLKEKNSVCDDFVHFPIQKSKCWCLDCSGLYMFIKKTIKFCFENYYYVFVNATVNFRTQISLKIRFCLFFLATVLLFLPPFSTSISQEYFNSKFNKIKTSRHLFDTSKDL